MKLSNSTIQHIYDEITLQPSFFGFKAQFMPIIILVCHLLKSHALQILSLIDIIKHIFEIFLVFFLITYDQFIIKLIVEFFCDLDINAFFNFEINIAHNPDLSIFDRVKLVIKLIY